MLPKHLRCLTVRTLSLLVLLKARAVESQLAVSTSTTAQLSLRPESDYASTNWWPWWTFNVRFQRSWATNRYHIVELIDDGFFDARTIIGNGHCHAWTDERPFNMYMVVSTRGQCGDEDLGEYGRCTLSLFSDRGCTDAVGELEHANAPMHWLTGMAVAIPARSVRLECEKAIRRGNADNGGYRYWDWNDICLF